MNNKNLINLGSRVFTDKDQVNFAKFSNDYNPIHLDKKYARKTLPGTTIVHGMHALLWSMELFLSKYQFIYSEYKVYFHKYIKENSIVNLFWDSKLCKLIIKNTNDINLVTISCINKSSVTELNRNACKINYESKSGEPAKIEIQRINVGDTSSIFYNGKKDVINKILPLLSKSLNHEIIKEIALQSYIVGMKVPGLNSLLASINFIISFLNKQQTVTIKHVNKYFNSVKSEYLGKNITSILETFFRPEPVKPISCAEILDSSFKLPNLKNKSVFVVGGSRGLGAITCKLLACAGARVTLSYNYGREEALAVADDIKSIGGLCKVIQFTVSPSQTYKVLDDKYEHVYYFATNKIFHDDIRNSDKNIYDSFYEIYVNCFKSLAEYLIKNSQTKKIFYPSSIAIEKPIDTLKDYIEAKKEGEQVCMLLQKKFLIKVICPRLNRILTDQTNTIVPVKFDNPVDTMLVSIKQMSCID